MDETYFPPLLNDRSCWGCSTNIDVDSKENHNIPLYIWNIARFKQLELQS